VKLKKVVSTLCGMGEHEVCDPRWTEDDESGLPTISCRCTCGCHSTMTPQQRAKAMGVFAQAKKEQEAGP
jgi:hypothetical protein